MTAWGLKPSAVSYLPYYYMTLVIAGKDLSIFVNNTFFGGF